jgi:hypothetical protein
MTALAFATNLFTYMFHVSFTAFISRMT